MRRWRPVAPFLLIALVILFCSSAQAAGSRGGSVEDQQITLAVYSALGKEFQAQTGDNAEFVVKTFHGDVILGGAANEPETVKRAVEIVRRVPGVQSVENRMSLRQY